MEQLTAKQIAELVEGSLEGDAEVTVTRVQSLREADHDCVSFLGNDKYASQVNETSAAAVLLPREFEGCPASGRAWIRCDNPSAAFSKVISHFSPPPVEFAAGRHPTAVIAEGATVADSAYIGPHCIIENGAAIGAGTVLMGNVYIGHETQVGEQCRLYPHVTVRERCQLGNGVIIHAGTVVGSDGFGYVTGKDGHQKVPQVGIVRIDDDVEIGANAAIDRARFGTTWIKRGVKIDNLVQIAHNVTIGEHSIIVAQVGIAGSTELGRGVVVAGQAGLSGHLQLGDGATVMGMSGVAKDLPPGAIVGGAPAVDRREYARQLLFLRHGPKMKGQLKELSREVEALRQELAKLSGKTHQE